MKRKLWISVCFLLISNMALAFERIGERIFVVKPMLLSIKIHADLVSTLFTGRSWIEFREGTKLMYSTLNGDLCSTPFWNGFIIESVVVNILDQAVRARVAGEPLVL